VSESCARCPYVGKAYGFEQVDQSTGSAERADAVLLGLEPYTADLPGFIQEHLRHAPGTEFPCPLCACGKGADDVWKVAPAMPAGLGPRGMGYAGGEKVLEDWVSLCGSGEVISLWDYIKTLRQHSVMPSEAELVRIALQLSQAVHALHTVAHVRYFPDPTGLS
jgi:hypothetical protein